MEKIPINIVCEDDCSEGTISKIIAMRQDFEIDTVYKKRGRNYISENINFFNDSAEGTVYIILADLDFDECAPKLVNDWLNENKHHNLILRIAVPEVESWLIADTQNFSRYFNIPKEEIREDVEDLHDAKEYLFFLIRKYCKKDIQDDILPKGTSTTGKGYNKRMLKYISSYWKPYNAQKNSDSLFRCIKEISNFNPHFK
jgi:hypothetical protein